MQEDSVTDEPVYDLRQQNVLDDSAPPLRARLTHVQAEAVVTEPDEPGWIGATKHSNNTGELTALFRALERAEARDADGPAEEIWTDSLYARNMTLGIWKTRLQRPNTALIKELRAKWRRVQAKCGVGA